MFGGKEGLRRGIKVLGYRGIGLNWWVSIFAIEFARNSGNLV